MDTVSMTDFVTLPVYFPKNNKEDQGYFKSEIRVNPFYLMYYYPAGIKVDDKEVEVTAISISSSYFYIAMPYIDFDNMWAEVKRGFKSDE